MEKLLDKFRPILVIVSAHTDNENLQQDCKENNIDMIQPKPMNPDDIKAIIN